MTKARDNADTASGGLVHINTTSVNSAASVSLNSVFSSTYDNYRILIQGTHATTGTGFFLRLRSGSTDASGANYQTQRAEFIGTSGIFGRITNATGAAFGYINNTSKSSYDLTIFSPFLSETTVWSQTQGYKSASTTIESQFTVGGHTLTNSYDGITFYAETGNIATATISVYGYRKA